MALSDTDLADLVQQIKGYDYIRFTWPDLHGIARGKVMPVRQAEHALRDGISCYSGMIVVGPKSELTDCKKIAEVNYCNISAKPTCNKACPIPWAGGGVHRVGEVLCEPFWKDGTIQQASPRHVAQRQLAKLKDMGFELLSACEQEFIFAKDGEPLFDGKDYCTHFRFSDVEDIMFGLDQNMQNCGIEAETMEIEYSPGQVEMTFKPKFGIETADDMFRFKNGVKEFTKKKGVTTVFMTKPFPNEEASCGTHFNHSLWDRTKRNNLLYEPKKPDNISDVGLHWLGGIIKHMDALTALCCPTQNCYRRMHTPWAPDKKEWDIDNRLLSWRVKNTSERSTYMESRIPSGASNIYIVMAATVAAGMDGIKNKLQPPPRGARADAEPLPDTLGDALCALEADKVICEALGEEFVEWFLCCKRTGEMLTLGKHDLKQFIEAEFKAEQKEYFELI